MDTTERLLAFPRKEWLFCLRSTRSTPSRYLEMDAATRKVGRVLGYYEIESTFNASRISLCHFKAR